MKCIQSRTILRRSCKTNKKVPKFVDVIYAWPRNANCASPKKGRRKDPFIFRRTTAAAAAAFYTEITGLLNTVVSLAGAARDMDSHVCNLVTKT